MNSLRFGIGSTDGWRHRWLSSHPPIWTNEIPKTHHFCWLEMIRICEGSEKLRWRSTRSLCFLAVLVHFLEIPIALLVNHVKSAMSFSHWLMKTEGLMKTPMVCVERAVKEKKHATTFIDNSGLNDDYDVWVWSLKFFFGKWCRW